MQLFYLKILLVVVGSSRAHRSGGADYSAIVPFVNDGNSVSEEQVVGIPIVKDVSAMCSISGGIHGQIEFDRPFSGRIYSIGFDNVHECIYFNGFYSKRVLFTIPINNCGTHLTHNTREVVDMVENRVYVQMDKYTLTGFDHKYAFVCELSPMPPQPPPPPPPSSLFTQSRVVDNAEVREIRRHPSAFLPSTHSGERSGVDAGNDGRGGGGGGWIKTTQRARPIIPQNAPKGVEPALLFYGNQQWKVPPENINFRRTTIASAARNRSDLSAEPDYAASSHQQHTHPTVIVPLAAPDDAFRGGDQFLAASGLSEVEQKLLSGNDELYWNRIREINRGSYAVEEQPVVTTTAAVPRTTPRPSGVPREESEDSSTIERTSIVPLYESITATPSTPAPTFIRANGVPNNYVAPLPGPHSVVVLPFASQQRPPTASVIAPAPERTAAPVSSYLPPILVDTSKEDIFTSNISSASDVDRSIYLEIKRGAATASLTDTQRFEGTVKIGEPITLAVHAKTTSKDPRQYNIFVHSCYSSGGTNDTRIRLIDNLGCAVHPQVLGSMRRERVTTGDGDELVYYFSMYAFKFPNGDDVHFFCSVDISAKYNFPELCPASTGGGPAPVKVVRRRELAHQDDVVGGGEETRVDHELRVFNTTYVADDDMDEDVRSGRYRQVRGNMIVSDQDRLVDSAAAAQNPTHSRRSSIIKYATLVGTTVVSAIVLVFIAVLCLLLRSS